MNEQNPVRKEFKFECTQCGNCCTDKATMVNVTYFDILKIQKGLDLKLDEIIEILGFYVFDEELSEEDKKKMVIPPIETEKGLAFIGLLKKNNGACYFYDEKNKRCLIYKLRPNFCRTFPFSFQLLLDKDDKTRAKIKMSYTEKSKKYCLGIGNEAPFIDENEWINLGKKTLEELNDNYLITKKWNDSVKQSLLAPTVKNFLYKVLKSEKNNIK